jgi:hypothetical protein
VRRCGACKSLKKSFREEGDRVVSLSSKFVMVSIDGSSEEKLGVRFNSLCTNCCIDGALVGTQDSYDDTCRYVSSAARPSSLVQVNRL